MHEPVWVGRFYVAVVCEGFASLELSDELPGAGVDWAAERALHPWAFVGDASWPWHVHAFAVHGPAGIMMIDACVSPFPPISPWTEHMPLEDALRMGEVDPTEVQMVVHTHLHADHAGGSVLEGEPRFPNATHVIHPADWSYFAERSDEQDYTPRRAMQRLSDLGMVDLAEDDREVWPGVRVVHTPGHTPGHRSVVLSDADETLVLTGDLLHVPAQVPRPGHPSAHDVDAQQACRSREALLEEAGRGGWLVGVSHFARPFGHVGASGWEGSAEA
jgi:glyoxylase-like metal-dependent hydrolase (beta-lactamase superfamily II)